MTAAIFDLDAIRKRLRELGVTTVAGDEFPKPAEPVCYVREGKGWRGCPTCERPSGVPAPCPPKED